MPELAEVEWFRKQWNPGLGDAIRRIKLHSGKYLFRGTDTAALREQLRGKKLESSARRGKQMAFRFSGDNWLGIHLWNDRPNARSTPRFQTR